MSDREITAECFLVLNSWAGRRAYRCTIVGETKTKYRIKFLVHARLPRNRFFEAGAEVLVPKYAVLTKSENSAFVSPDEQYLGWVEFTKLEEK